MENEELNNAKEFLNKQSFPTPNDLINLFFREELNKIAEGEEDIDIGGNIDIREVDFDSLGDADDITIESGSVWAVTRLLWDTPEGQICKFNVVKIDDDTSGDFFITNSSMDDLPPIDPIYLYEPETVDFDDVNPKPYHQQLEEAIEEENFEEAARLRDWHNGLTELVSDLKPKIMDALEKADIKKLEEYLTRIRIYRNTL